MAEVFFDNPPALQGDEERKLQQLYGYLSAMSEKLNVALMDVSIDQMAPETRKVITDQGEKSEKNYDSLKTMIIKTAEVVRNEMDEINTTLTHHYEALSSQFGTYESELETTITQTAEGVLQEYNFFDRVQGLEDETAQFENHINTYIYMGLLDPGTETTGIAIGEKVTNEDGSLNDQAKSATFTQDELAFWQGEQKVAWFSNNVMHIANSEVQNSMKMGNHTWQILTGGALGLVSG